MLFYPNCKGGKIQQRIEYAILILILLLSLKLRFSILCEISLMNNFSKYMIEKKNNDLLTPMALAALEGNEKVICSFLSISSFK